MKAFFLLAMLLFPLFVLGQSEEQPDTAKTQQKIYIVNGIPMDQDSLVNIDPDEIESISIIKDGSLIKQDCYTCPQIVIITLKKHIEHRIYVIAEGFDSFLATQRPKEFYTKELLRNKNILMVNEWNRRYENPMQSGSIYGTKIDYNPKEDYGLEIEYQLYMFFKFMEKENNMSL